MRRVAVIVSLILSAAGCDRQASPAPPEPSPSVAGADPTSRPVPPPSREPPGVAADEPFDFWRVILDPAAHVGMERTCVAMRVSDVGDHERYVHPDHRSRPARMVSCRRDEDQTTPVVVTVHEEAQLGQIRASESNEDAPDLEVRLSLRVIGLDARGQTPNGELVRVTQLTLDGPDDPTHRPSRCCRERRRPDDPDEERREPPPHPGFEFGTWTEHVGTEQLCVVGFAPPPQRVDEAHPPAVHTPDGVVAQFYASCASEGGAEHLRLFFTPETAAQALRVRRGAFVRGTLTGSGDLWVTSVSRTPSQYEDLVDAR